MKRFIILSLFALLTFNANGQNFNFDNGKNLIWQCIYETEMTSSELHKALHTCANLHNVRQVDSTFYVAELNRCKVEYEELGYKRMKLPLYVVNNDIGSADVIIQYKPGKYRVTFKNIDLLSTTNLYYGNLQDMATDENGHLQPFFLEAAIYIYNYNFKKWLELEEVSNDW